MASELQRCNSSAAEAMNPFADVGARPLTWSRALTVPVGHLYRDGPLSPQQWREWWERGWTVIRSPVAGAVDYAGMKARFVNLVEENIRGLIEGGTLEGEQLAGLRPSEDSWDNVLRKLAAVEEIVPGNTSGSFAAMARSELHSEEMHATVSHKTMLAICEQLTGAQDICLPGNYALRCKGPSAPPLAAGQPDSATVPWHQ